MRTRAPYDLYRPDDSPFWYVNFIDRDGARVRKSTRESNKERAHAVARELERQHADPTYRASNGTSLSVASADLKEHLENKGRSAETLKFYGVKLSQVGRLLGADTPLSAVTTDAVDAYIRARKSESASRYTISKELTALRMLLRVARRKGKFDREVSQVMPVGFSTGYVPRKRRVTREEAWALIGATESGSIGRYVAFVCATTARDSAVARAVGAHYLPGIGIQVHDFKTAASTRTVPLTRVTQPFAELAFAGVPANRQVAPGLGSVRHALDRACARLGIDHVSPNDLRRSVAHWLLAADVPRDIVAAFMGHASTKMLDLVYGKLDTREIGAAISRALAVTSLTKVCQTGGTGGTAGTGGTP